MAETTSSRDAGSAWEPMTLTYVGDAGEVLKTGQGKTSPAPTDPGEVFENPGVGNPH
jgi:hypothetical protein